MNKQDSRNNVSQILKIADDVGLIHYPIDTHTCDKCRSDNIEEVVTNNTYKMCLNCSNNNLDMTEIRIYLKRNIAQSRPQILLQSITPVDVWSSENKEREVISTNFNEIYGNVNIIRDLRIIISSSIERQEALENMLFFGPPGLGKTTIANAVAVERNVDFVPTLASTLKKADIINILRNIKPFAILFIDEIHDLNKSLSLILYTAMEDNYIDMVENGKALRIKLPDFTIIGATTNPGRLMPAMRSRFSNKYTLSLYDENVLYDIIVGVANKLNVGLTTDAAQAIALRSRGTPRNAIALLKKARAYADAYNNNYNFGEGIIGSNIDLNIASMAFEASDIDEYGLSMMDRKYLETVEQLGVAGLDTIAATMGDSEDNIEAMVEPWLLAQGYIIKTSRGRKITNSGKNLLDNHIQIEMD